MSFSAIRAVIRARLCARRSAAACTSELNEDIVASNGERGEDTVQLRLALRQRRPLGANIRSRTASKPSAESDSSDPEQSCGLRQKIRCSADDRASDEEHQRGDRAAALEVDDGARPGRSRAP